MRKAGFALKSTRTPVLSFSRKNTRKCEAKLVSYWPYVCRWVSSKRKTFAQCCFKNALGDNVWCMLGMATGGPWGDWLFVRLKTGHFIIHRLSRRKIPENPQPLCLLPFTSRTQLRSPAYHAILQTVGWDISIIFKMILLSRWAFGTISTSILLFYLGYNPTLQLDGSFVITISLSVWLLYSYMIMAPET